MALEEPPTVPADPFDAPEDEAQLDLHVGPAPSVVDHRAVGADPHVAVARTDGPVALGVGAQDGLGAGRRRGLETGSLGSHPAVDLAVADRQAAQLLERPGRPRVRELGGEPEGALPDSQGVLAAGLEAEGRIERHELPAAGSAAIATTVHLHLAREGHDAPSGPAVGAQDTPAAGVAGRHGHEPLERAHELGPEPLARLRQGDRDRSLERSDVGALGTHLERECHRDGDRLHGEPLRLLVLDISSLRTGLTSCPAWHHRRWDAYCHARAC